MEQYLYDLMDWRAVEEIVYSESENPHAILGAHPVAGGVLIQAFVPGAKRVQALILPKEAAIEMEEADENGFFACLVPERRQLTYRLRIVYEDGREEEIEDPYRFVPEYDSSDLRKFAAGTHYEIYRKMGAHLETRSGVSGVSFSVWAPNAMRVSVVGDFNHWDGRRHQMRRLGESGIFHIFIPGLDVGMLYQYEIKTRKRELRLKADPYAFASELRPGAASVVADISRFPWEDKDWMESRPDTERKKRRSPLSIYEMNLCSWRDLTNYRELAAELAVYLKEMGYTHVQLMPVMEYPLDESLGYQTGGYYAPTARLGTPEDFMWFVNHLHREGIGVIVDWTGARFPKDSFSLADFDGTPLYELPGGEADTAVFQFGRTEVENFLIANVLFWAKEYHIDGFRVMDMSSILYFNAADGVRSNLYGGGENLDGAVFLQRLNTVMKKQCPGVMMIGDGSAERPKTTNPVKDGGLGFDFRWNTGWTHGLIGYMQRPEDERSAHYGEMTYSLLYQYSESFILPLFHEAGGRQQASLTRCMPGEKKEQRLANLRVLLGFFMAHPGKKLLFSGQEFGMEEAWHFGRALSWELLKEEPNRRRQNYVRDWNRLYLEQPALWLLDEEPAGFDWINCHSWQENVAVFLRRTREEKEDLLIAVNFSERSYPKFNVGVPYHGSYKEIFNSDREEYGGSNLLNLRALSSKKTEVDERRESITMRLPAHSVLVFSCRRRPAEAGGAAGPGKADGGKGQKSKKAPAEVLAAHARAAKRTAAGTAAAAKKAAAETAASAQKTAVKTASAAKKTALEAASAAKRTATGTAAAAKKAAAETAANAQKTAAKTAAAAKKAAAKTAANAQKTAAKTAEAAKKAAAKTASMVRKTAEETWEELRGNGGEE